MRNLRIYTYIYIYITKLLIYSFVEAEIILIGKGLSFILTLKLIW